MRGRWAWASDLAARSTSSAQQRASAATRACGNSRLTASTASKSPSEAMGKPASRMSTPRSTSFRAIRSFSGTVMLQPGDCSPSRSVVSKIVTRSLMQALCRSFVRFSKFIILAVSIKRCYNESGMELYSLRVFLTVATEKSFSRAAEKLLRTQPAVSLGVQRLEKELGEKLIDRTGKDLILTDAGRTVLDYARRFQSLQQELDNALAELRDNSAGRLIIGANESTSLYLLRHIERYRELYPKVKVQVRRSLSSKIPNELLDGNLELGVISYDPGDERLKSKIIYTDALAFVVSPRHRLAHRKTVSITELGAETFIAHNVVSPYREVVLREFRAHKVPLQMPVEMPTIET